MAEQGDAFAHYREGCEDFSPDEDERGADIVLRNLERLTIGDSERSTPEVEQQRDPEQGEGETSTARPGTPLASKLETDTLMKALLGHFSANLFAKMDQKFKENSSQLASQLDAKFTEQTRQTASQFKQLNEKFAEQTASIKDLEINLSKMIEDRCRELDSSIVECHSKCARLETELSKFSLDCERKAEEQNGKIIRLIETSTKRHDRAEERVRQCEESVTTVQRKLEDLPKQVESQVSACLEGTSNTVKMFAVPNIAIPPNLTFAGKINENPCGFLKAVENFFVMINVPEEKKTRLIYQMMQGNGKIWFDTLDPFPKNMIEFREKFLERYWGRDTQINFKMSVLSGFWKNSMGTMRDYAAEKIALLRTCRPVMTDEEIMCVLIRHFPVTTQNLLKSVTNLDLQKFQLLLGNYDATYESFGKPRETGNPKVNVLQLKRDDNDSRLNKSSSVETSTKPSSQQTTKSTSCQRKRGVKAEQGKIETCEDAIIPSTSDYVYQEGLNTHSS